ncbi:EAL domain-containing response regulator [Marinospirillum insulare]|nr:EAL domain-containing protein [Marinospirillum insulare]
MNLLSFSTTSSTSKENDELLYFTDELETSADASQDDPAAVFKVLIVDDDEDIHLATRLTLKNMRFKGRRLEFIDAYSGEEAYYLLQTHPDTAVMLLDVVMETEQAGLNLIGQIRHHLGLQSLRIILRTGQPGYAPELQTVARYDINDYKTKTELTHDKLHVIMMTALRSYLLYEELVTLAYDDALTGLLNRNGLINMLDLQLGICLDQDEQSLQLALIDLNQFSVLNDTFGTRQGDLLLKAFARRLESQAGCVVAARLNADHFALVYKGDAEQLKARESLTEPILFDDIEHPLSFCIGVATCTEGMTGDELLSYATMALKRAKNQGHGSCVIFNPSMVEELRYHSQMLRSLKRDLDLGQLFLEYQPQIDLATSQLLGVEALVRWHPAGGQRIPPDQFIHLAEQSGLIIKLGDWVLQQALLDLQELLPEFPNIRMAVNVSALQFNQPDFETKVAKALKNSGVSGQNLDLEITESVGVLGSLEVENKFTYLKQLGVTLSIDDFGTGFSSLSYLEKLSADRLKIDRSFVAKLDASDSGQRIVQMIIGLGQRLNLQVLAEGIETNSQLEELKALGCHEGQGYLIARPLALDALLEWIDQWDC